MSEVTTPRRPISRLAVTALFMILITSLTSRLSAGTSLILAAANLNVSEYQSPPASQEAEELRKGIQQLIELEKKMREDEARKAGPGGATGQAPTTQPAHKPALQPGATAVPNDDKHSALMPSSDSQPGEATPPTTAPRTGLSEPAAPSTATGADQPTGVPQTGPASTPDLAVAGEELVGPPANFRTIRPQRRPTPTGAEHQPTGQPIEPGGAAAPVTIKAPEARPVVSADGRNEFFNFDKTPWEDVVKYFAEKLDKPVMGIDELVMGGELTYINPKRFTLEEAIDELNLLMQYQGYRFVETENYIEVIPLSEMPMRVPVKRIYPTREAYVADLPKLRRMDWVIVHYKVLDKPARMLVDTFGDALPDHARISVLGDTNTIKLVGTVLDLNRFFDLAELVSLEPTDPRQIKVFEIQTNAAEVERMVRALMDLPQTPAFGQPFQRIQRPRPGVAQQQVGVPQPEEELEAIITADERTNSLIVKATPSQMQQIEKLIKQIDIKPNLGEFKTAVVPILYADATEVERVLTQIFQQERGQTGPAWQQQRQLQLQRQQQQQRRNLQQPVQPQAQQPTPESIIAEGIFEQAKKTVRIAADERTNSLIVYANDDGQKRVKELLKIIDVAVPSNFRSFRIVNTEAAKIYPVVEQIAQGLGGLSTRATRGRGGVRVVLDEANESLLVLADREEMVKIEEVIQRLDVAGPELTRHVVHLEKLLPSKVAPTLQQLMSEQPGAAGGAGRGRRGPAMVSGVGTAQIIPLDEAKLLIVICGDRDWEKVQETLSQWDDEAISDQPEFVTYEVKNAQAGQLANMIDAFYRNYQHPVLGRSQVVVQAQGNALLVQAIEPAQDEIAELIQRLDVGDLTKIEVLRLQHADAADVAEQAQRLFSIAGGTGVRGRAAPAAAAGETLIDAEPATNSLIVRADSATIERIKDFALAQDLRVGQFVPEPRFYTLKFAKPREVAEAVNALFGGGARSVRGGRGGGGGGATRGTSVTAMDTQTQVVVEAPAEKHEQIAKFIANLDSPEGREAVTTLVKMPGAPVSQIAGTLRQNFRQRVQDQGMVAEFNADTTTETILITCTQTLMPEVERLIGEFKTMTSELVMQRDFRKLKFAPAEETAKWLEPQLQATVTTLLGSAAAKQVQVIPEPRTGRVMIYAPQVAVKEAMQLLEQYDIEVADPTPPNFMHTEARKLAGLDVRNLAQNLTNIYNSRPQRPDRLKATFQADELTESIILSVPKDWKQEVDDLIGQFASETEKVAAEQRFYDLKNADAAYVVQKLTDVLVSKVRQRRPSLADRIQITVDDRLNRVVINAPKVVHEDAAALVAELDQPPLARNQLRTIALTNLEAEQAFQVLQKVFQDKISKQKTLQVTSDPTTNSIVIRGTDDDYNEISRWLSQQDGDAAGKKRDLRVLTLDNATSPDQIVAVLTERYSPKGVGRREKVGNEVSFQTLGSTGVVVSAPQDQISEIETLVKVLDQATSEADLVTEFIDVHFADPSELANVVRQFFGEWKRTQGAKAQNVYVTVANNTLLVRAPATEMAKIKQVIEQADADVPMALDVKSFDLKVMSAESVAQQVNFFLATLGTVSKKGEIRPFAYGEGNTNTLVVGAPRKYMPFITGLISGIEAKQIPQGEPKSYPLQFVRAEQVQANIQTLMDAKVNENEAGRKSKTPVKVVAEPSTNRLFIYAPEQYQRLAEQVVQMVDSELETGEVVRIVQLERGDAKQLAQTLTGMQNSGRVGAGAGQAKVNITADEGSNSVILRGLPKDVAELQKHASALEDKSDVVPDLRVFNIRYASTGQMLDILQPMFEGAGKGATAVRPVTFTEDEDHSRLIVTANRRQMAQIADVIAELDVNPYNPDGTPKDDSGKQIYFVDITRGDAFDIAWDVRDLFPDEDKGGPSIDSDWDGKYIKVKCRPGEFASVLKAIRDVESRAVVEKKIVVRNAPPQKQQERTFDYLKSRMENVQINVAPVSTDEETMVEVLRPDAKKKKQDAAGARSRDQKPADERGARPPAGADARFRKGGGMGRLGCLVLTLLLQDAAAQTPPAADMTGVSTSQPSYSAPSKREGAQILVQPDGKLVIFGPEDAVDEVEKVLDMIEEDLTEGQVLRIFEFTYGDVNAAAEVLNIMFNDRQAAQLQQALQQQQLQQQQQQQQQQRQRQAQGRGDDGDNKEQQGGGVVDQIRGMVGGQQPGGDRRTSSGARQAQQGGQRIKIATDASHNYLIVKCDETDLPEIRKLLRELDIPPGESDIRVFQLVRVDAMEAAENIRSVLKIDKAKSRSGAAGVAPGTAGRGAQQDMLQMLQQQMMSVPGVEGGAKIESVEVVPNKITNSLLVSAPPEAMKVIETLIQTLEDLEAREVLGIYYFDLAHAKVDDVLPLLREVFQASAGGSRSASPAALGPVTLSADPRSNRIIYTAQAKDVATVEAQIRTLDIEGPFAEAETHVLQYGNAATIADTVEQIFAAASAGGRREGAGASSALALRIAAEPATNSITVWGPADKRTQIFKKVREFEEMSRRSFRDLTLIYADADDLAEKLRTVFAGGGGAARGGRSADAAQAANSVVIVGDKNAKKLLVKAPDAVYEQIEALVKQLDAPNETLKFRTFAVKHADAQVLVDRVKTAFLEYMAQLPRTPGGKPPFDPFTAVADPRTNSVTVVGSDTTLAFVGKLLGEVDVPTPTEQHKQFRIFALDKADAVTVADAINTFAQGGAAGPSGANRSGLRPGLTPGGANAPILAVNAIPESTMNAVMVYGKPEDIEIVDREVLQKLEQLGLREEFATITVQQAAPSQIVTFVQQFLDEFPAAQSPAGRGPQSGGAARRGPRMIPNDVSKQIVVRGSPGQIKEVQDLVARFDNKDLAAQQVKVRRVPSGQDAQRLAQEVEQLVNGAEEQAARASGRPARPVVVGSDPYTNTIILAGAPENFGLVDALLDQLEKMRNPNQVTRVIQFTNLTSDDAQSVIDQLQSRRQGANTGRGRTRSPNQQPGFFPGGGNSGGTIRRPVGPTGPRRGAWRIERAAPLPLASGGNGTWLRASPTIVASSFTPMLVGFALDEATKLAMAASQPAAEAAQVAQAPQNPQPERPRAFGADRAQAEQARPAQPPAGLPDLTGVTGTLQGDVIVQPIGTKQIIVTGDEQDIAFIEQILALMEQSAPRPQIEIFTLQNAKAAPIAEVVTKAMEQFIQSSGTPAPEDRFSISAETGSNSLIVSAADRNMTYIADLISKLDVERVEGQTEFKTIILANALASDVVTQLKPAIERLGKIRSVPAEAQPSVQAFNNINGVLVIGTPKDISEIARLVEALDVKLDDEIAAGASFTRADVILIPLRNAVAEDVAKTLTDMIKEQQDLAREAAKGEGGKPFVRKLKLRTSSGLELPELDLERPIRIIAEKGTNSLIVFSAAKNLEPLQAIVAVFDTLPAAEDVSVRAFVLKYGRSEAVAELLDKVFKEGKGALRRTGEGAGESIEKGVLPPAPPGAAGKGLPYNVAVSHDARSNTVLVIGQKDAVLLAGGLVAELDKPSAQLGVEPHIVELKNIAAAKLAERLQDVLDKRMKTLGDGNDARDNAVLIPEDRSNLLVVFATQEMFELVNRLANELDQAPSYTTIDTRMHELKFADAAKLQKTLQDLFDKKKEAEPGDEPKNTIALLADPRTNSLLLTGTRDYLAEAETLIDRLDRQGLSATVDVEVFPIQFNNPANIATLIQELIDKSRTDDNKGTPVYLKADAVSRNVLVAAAREDMSQIRRWVDLLDKPAEIGLKTAIVPLQRGSAEDVADRVDELFKPAGGQGGAGETGLSITYDAVTNSIVAVGPPSLVAEVEGLVRKLDTTDPSGGALVRIFRLDQADAESAGELLQSILQGRGGAVGGRTGGGTTGGGSSGAAAEAARKVMLIYEQKNGRDEIQTLRALRDEVVVTADTRTNSLVITAPPASMALLESLVAAIDVPPRSDKIEVFALRNSDAEQMSTTLQEIFNQQASTGTAGRTTGRTTAGGQQSEEERRLTFAGTGGTGREQITFTADIRTNSVIAAGTPGYLKLAEELVYRLDTQPIEDRKTIVYAPRNIVAADLASSIRDYSEAEQSRLQALGEDISAQRKQEREIVAIDNENANRVILSFSPRFESDVLDIVRELDQPPPQVSIETLIIQLQLNNSLDLGMEFAFQDLQFAKAGPTDTTTFDFVGGTDVGAAGSGGLGGFTFTITGADFNFLFRTLQSEGRLSVLSRPHIVAMDNQEAVIKVVNDVPYVSGTSTSIAGQITTQVNREEVGITLEVTPHINPDGYVRLEIRQEVSDIGTSSIPIQPGVNAPIFLVREAETVVTVRDGETVVLGGLIRSRDEDVEQKIPIVGDIPLLGALFRTTSQQREQEELLVVLTPRVLRSVEDYREESIFQRDRSGTLPGEILTSPLMNRLRVPPEELAPSQQDGALGPFRQKPERYKPYTDEGRSRLPEDLRPQPSDDAAPSRSAAPPPPAKPSFDVPLPSRRSGPAQLSAQQASYDLPIPASYRARVGT